MTSARSAHAGVLFAGLLAVATSAAAEPVTTIRNNGSPSNRVDIVVLGDGYTATEIAAGKFAADTENAVLGFFAEQPFAEYRRYFNVHRIDVTSVESGADHPSRAIFRNTALHATYDCAGITRLICVNFSAVSGVLSRTITDPNARDIVLVIVNDPEYGGSGGSFAVASVNSFAVELVLHEIGHSFGLLADEYGGPPPPSCDLSEPPSANATTVTARTAIKWRAWIDPSTPVPTTTTAAARPGLYAGARYCDSGMYRPTYNSKMRGLDVPFEQVNTEQFVRRIYNLVSPVDSVSPAAGSPIIIPRLSSQLFSVTVPLPSTHALSVAWVIDGTTVATGPSFSLAGSLYSTGSHTLTATVSDPTAFVRTAPAGLLRTTRTWVIAITEAAPTITTQPRNQTIVSSQTATLRVVATGTGLSYQWYVGSSGTTTSAISGATASNYMTPALTSTRSYWVRVSNASGSADSNAATLAVRGGPGDFNGDGSGDIAMYRPSTGQWFIRNQASVQFGEPGDIPVPGDYNGNRVEDIAVFRPSTGQWFVRNQFTVQFGDRGDVPVPGDFNGDGVTDVAVYRPSTGDWFVRNQFVVNFGGPGHVPIVGDYNGDGTDDVAVFQPSTGMWFVRNQAPVPFGTPGDRPVQGDYDGNGTADIAVYRPSSGQWLVRNQLTVQLGTPGDVPVPLDYDGNGTLDVAIYRRSTGQWFVKDQVAVSFGAGRDMPVPLTSGFPPAVAGDYDGDGATDIVVHRPSTNEWFVRNQLAVPFGSTGDVPVPADYNGDRRTDVAVYRPTTGHWFVRNQPTVQFGDLSDKPVPGDYNGDGLMDVAVYRPSTGTWFVRNKFTVQFGEPGDIPLPGDYNGDGLADLAVYRPSSGQWFVRNQLAVSFGDPGDIPVPADYNGDGKMDIAVYRPSTGTWYVRNQLSVVFGDTGDVAVPGDYNGDGLTDIVVYRPATGQWFVRNLFTVQFGDATYVPMVRIGGSN